MLLCLIESETNIIKPLLPEFTSKFPTEYVIHVRSRKLSASELERLQHKPLLCKQWCIVLHSSGFPVVDAKKLAEKNFVIWQVDNKKIAAKLQSGYEGLRILDNSILKEEDVIAWIRKELSVYNAASGTQIEVSKKDAQYLYRRVDGYVDYLVQAVGVLKFELGRGEHTVFSQALAHRYVTKVSPVKRFHIRNILLGGQCTFPEYMIAAYLSRGLYDWKSLRDYIMHEIKNYEAVFEAEMQGDLDMHNLHQYMKENPSLELTDKELQSILLAHRKISYEWLLYLETYVSQLRDDALGACMFCSFVCRILRLRDK